MVTHIKTFNGAPVTGATPHLLWEAIQHGAIVCEDITKHIARLRNPVSGEICFIFWDEVAQMSMPYATVEDAKHALAYYIENCL